MKLDPELLPALTPALKKAGLTQSQLQTVAESFLEFQTNIPQRMLDRDAAQLAKDPELGGLNYARTISQVEVALNAFGDPAFKQFVKAAGIGNRLEFVRVFQRIGQAMEGVRDGVNTNQPNGAPETTRAQRMYGGTSKTNT